MKYRMEWQTLTFGLPWHYDYDMASDDMAIDYAKRTTQTSLGFRAEGMAMLVWKLKELEGGEIDGELLARFVLDQPQARDAR